ncbi:MAG: 4'-phosphopantetheinyl transferase superfamily protein [Oleispira sp.]|nr:4'-phosphopantetheinyl transferase superfamily protein [Oleispira sp.]MBL4880412.1 4'-phosphopantetheinyl transferase superfamily protein [Oleispira sp.]
MVFAHISQVQHFAAELTCAAEQEKESRYVQLADRQRHRLAHGLKRCLLAQFFGLSEQQLQFKNSAYGKPYLVRPEKSDLKFNLSHSGDWVALALAEEIEVGIDVESAKILADSDWQNLVLLIRHKKDPVINNLQDFYRLWVMKESVVKALGLGLSLTLDKFSISFTGHAGFQAQLANDLGPCCGWYGALPDGTPIALASLQTAPLSPQIIEY